MNDIKTIYDAIHKKYKDLVNSLTRKEDKSNKVSTVTESDEQYPTAKAVNDKVTELADKVGVDLNKYKEYFTIEATEDDTTVYFRQSSYAANDGLDPLKVEVSTDDGATWTEITASVAENDVPGAVLATLDAGEKILIRGNNSAYGYHSENEGDFVENCNFLASKPCYVYGNIMSLVSKTGFENLQSVEENAFTRLFSYYDAEFEFSWAMSKDDESLLLPATTLAAGCYASMFDGCTYLTTAPVLPATTLAAGCYERMFQRCSSLTVAPELPATTLEDNCYSAMFQNCTSLTTAPALPATTLSEGCYYGMFANCSSLTSAPVLPATTLVDVCYNYMFQNCTNLSYIKALFTTEPGDRYTYAWVHNVKVNGSFVKSSNAMWMTFGENGIPRAWKVNSSDPAQTEEQADWDEEESSRANYIWHKPEYSLIFSGDTLDVTGYNIPFKELCRFNKQPKMSFYDLYFLKTDENQPLITYLFRNLEHDFEDGYELMAAFGSFHIGESLECTNVELYGVFRKKDDDTEILVYGAY